MLLCSSQDVTAAASGTKTDAEDAASSGSSGAADIFAQAKAAEASEDLFLEGFSETLPCPSAGLLLSRDPISRTSGKSQNQFQITHQTALFPTYYFSLSWTNVGPT